MEDDQVVLKAFRARAVEYSTAARKRNPETARQWRDANRERLNANARAHGERRLAWFRSLKTGPCADCGVTFPPVCMDFDHRDPATKFGDVSVLARSKPAEIVLAEIEKCDLVCANCHRIRTEATHEKQRAKTRLKYTKPAPRWRRTLTSEQENEVCGRREHGETNYSLAKRFGVSRSCIFGVLVRGGVVACPPSWSGRVWFASSPLPESGPL